MCDGRGRSAADRGPALDGRASYAELARLVGLSSSAVHERVAKLESTGVITGFRATSTPASIGMGVTALVGIEPGEYGRDELIAAALEAIPEVESCYGVAGDEAFVVQVGWPASTICTGASAGCGRSRGWPGPSTTVVLATRFEHRPTRDCRSAGRSVTVDRAAGSSYPVDGYPGPALNTRPDAAADRGTAAAGPRRSRPRRTAVAWRPPGRAASGALFATLAVYTALRLALVVVLTAVLAFFMPLIVALMFAIIVQLPLAWLLFSGPRAPGERGDRAGVGPPPRRAGPAAVGVVRGVRQLTFATVGAGQWPDDSGH